MMLKVGREMTDDDNPRELKTRIKNMHVFRYRDGNASHMSQLSQDTTYPHASASAHYLLVERVAVRRLELLIHGSLECPEAAISSRLLLQSSQQVHLNKSESYQFPTQNVKLSTNSTET